jgi:hypothetical protein
MKRLQADNKWQLSGNKVEDFMISRDDKKLHKVPTKGECSQWWGVNTNVMNVFIVTVYFSNHKVPHLASYFWEKEARDVAVSMLKTKVFTTVDNITIQECPVYSTVANGESGYWHLLKDQKISLNEKESNA